MDGQFTPFRRVVIDKYTGPEITNFADLRKHYGTGQAYLISKNPEKKYGYRIGVQCNLGDIEESEWERLVEDLIKRCGEQELFSNLVDWVKASGVGFVRNAKEAKHEALVLHATRMFDNKQWRDYVAFNEKYRPDVLQRKSDLYIDGEDV